ncbi:MAG: hypothetical protein ABJE47_11195 [bacterium]
MHPLESLFTFLFKYSSRVFERGQLVLSPVLPPLVVALLAIVAAGVIVLAYQRVRAVSVADRIVLGTLRIVGVLVVLGCLLRPTVVLSSAVPQRNVLAILFDDSRSMKLHDVNGGARLAAMQQVFADTSTLMRRMGGKFALRTFRFAADAAPSGSAATITANGARTDLARALDVTREDLAGMPLAGVVVVTDGADNGGSDLGTSLLAMRARRVPVYTVGVGQERFARDVAIERVTAPASVLTGATVLVDVSLGVRGARGEQTTVSVEANGRLVGTEEVRLPDAGDVVRVRLRVPPLAPGTYQLTVKAKPIANEPVTENNTYRTVLDVRAGPARILYVEGEPRSEFAFIRRAVDADSAIQVVGIMRSADKKFLRLGVRDSMELVSGFPVHREELFRYRAIVLGSIESAFFSGDQLRMLADFVSQRGGSVLALGGRGALAEGGYVGTPLADVLPVVLEKTATDTNVPPSVLKVRPTPAGQAFAALQFRPNDGGNAARWDSLPPLSSVNRLGALRSGATVLLAGRDAGARGQVNDVPVLAYQRYGRGMSAVLNVQDTWVWRMDPTTPVEDQTYATFWRQMMRWLVESAPEQVELVASPSRVGPGEPVTLRAHITDSTFVDVNDASVLAHVTSPTGRKLDLPMEWSSRSDGSYTARFTADEVGTYALSADSRRGRDTTRSTNRTLLSDDQGADVEQAEQRSALLKRISTETGGRYYPLADAGKLADDVVFTEAGVTVRDAKDLWDMPVVFLVLACLLGAEWIYRRRRGLA